MNVKSWREDLNEKYDKILATGNPELIDKAADIIAKTSTRLSILLSEGEPEEERIIREVAEKFGKRAEGEEEINLKTIEDVKDSLKTLFDKIIWDDRIDYQEEAAVKAATKLLSLL